MEGVQIKETRAPEPGRAQQLLLEAEALNPGPWVAHSIHVAEAAKAIAAADPSLDEEHAYILGLLHDIGRREGHTSMRHTIDGYNYLRAQGHEHAARICMTHSLPLQNTDAVFGEWDCTDQERAFVDSYIDGIEYTDYDRLIQLCDALALPSGFVLIEKRMIDVALRYGTNALSDRRWLATFQLRDYFESRIGASLYGKLSGVVENTFPHLRGPDAGVPA